MRWYLRLLFAYPLFQAFAAGHWVIGLAIIAADVLIGSPEKDTYHDD